jgi:hypothetical protein
MHSIPITAKKYNYIVLLIYDNKFIRKEGKIFWITIFNEYGTVNVHIYGTDSNSIPLRSEILRNYVIDFDSIGDPINVAESEAKSLPN